MEIPYMHRFSDRAGSPDGSRIAPPAMLPSDLFNGVGTLLRVIQDERGGVTGVERVFALKSPARRSRAGLGVQGVAGMLSLSL